MFFISQGISSVCFLSSLRSLVPHNFSCQFEGFARKVMETVEHEDPTFHVEVSHSFFSFIFSVLFFVVFQSL